jgi:tetratricopeptide (TPR) repeat protein
MTIIYQRLRILIVSCVLSFFVFNSQIYASALDPQVDLYRSKGLQAQAKGNYKEALNFYLKAASFGPENPVLYNDIGLSYEQIGSPDQAEQYYLRILKIDSNYLPAYSNLAYLYLSQNQTEKAKEFFLERLKRAPANDPWKEKIRQELYRVDPGLKAAAIKEEMEETARRLAWQADQKAQQEFVLAVERAQKHYMRGESYRAQKKYSQAISEFDQALKVTPENPKLVKAKEQAQYEERIDEVNQRINAATAQLKTGEVDRAKNEFQQILAIIPKEPISNSKN